jgi:hydrogenase nickel incorporation protein HypB
MEEIRLIELKEDIMTDNNSLAAELKKMLKKKKTFLLNIMSSPGAGKTTLILKTIELLKARFRIAVIEADIDSTVDAEKVALLGVKAVQLRTGGFCHLDASMVKKGLDALDLDNLDLVIVENVGNLVCPAEFDTGAIRNVMILSIPEGDDKPLKYPLMFTVCACLIVSKMDCVLMFDFDMDMLEKRGRKLNPAIKILPISAKTGLGMGMWTEWLDKEIGEFTGSPA